MQPESKSLPYRVGILNSHPIQYFAPFYRFAAADPEIDLTVFYGSRQGLESYRDRGFGDVEISWDVPLLEGYESVFLENWRSVERLEGFWSLINPSLYEQLRRRDIEVLVIHGYQYATNLMAIAAARKLGIKVLIRGDTNPKIRRKFWKSTLRQGVLRLLYRQIDGALAAGKLNAEHYRRHGMKESRIFEMPFAVNNDYFQSRILNPEQAAEFRRREGLEATTPVILFASKMSPRKRAGDLLEAYWRARENGCDAQLVFVGDGIQRSALEQQAGQKGLDKVYFAGFRNQSELPAWYSIADIFVLPSAREPWGLVTNEVMNAGVPVICTDEVGAAADLVHHGETGYVYPAGEVERLSEHLRVLVEQPRMRRKMGEAARERIDQWGFRQALAGLKQAVADVTENSTDGSGLSLQQGSSRAEVA